jgi:hypothetical protein
MHAKTGEPREIMYIRGAKRKSGHGSGIIAYLRGHGHGNSHTKAKEDRFHRFSDLGYCALLR